MDIETHIKFIKLINEDFENVKKMLDVIRVKIAEYPISTQMEFIKPIKNMVYEAFTDANNPNDSFLNDFKSDGWDNIEVSEQNKD